MESNEKFLLTIKKNAETSSKPDEELKADDLQRLLNELEDLQAKFDRAAVDKHKLNAELESCIQRLDAATHIIEKYVLLEYCIFYKIDRQMFYGNFRF
jgi:hypothetical protein